MLLEWRLVDVEEIVGYMSKKVDVLANLCLKFDENRSENLDGRESRKMT
jgi:hypothetical protein